jgi:DNA-binding IclR family transcriptional regulator
MKAKMKEMGRHVEVVLRALDLLDCFQRQPALSLKEMATLTRMTRSRVTRLAGTLESKGYLLHDREKGVFRLGSRLLTLGKLFESNNNLVSLARPVLKELVQATGEMASLYVIDGRERVALAREPGTHKISYSITEGQRMELYAGAAGKVLLAFSPQELRARVINRKALKKLTPETVIDPGKLNRELEAIRNRGYAFSQGERVSDVWSVAAPVFDHTNKVCSAVGITGPIYRFPKQVRQRSLKIVLGKARDLSRRLGGQASQP